MNNERNEMMDNEYLTYHRIRENLRYKRENNELKNMIDNVYENDGLIKKVRSKENISLNKIENIIDDLSYFKINVEKAENVAKLNFEYLINREFEIENLEMITNDLSKNEFDIDINY